MPDHLHLVVEGLSDGADLQRFVKIAKQRVVDWVLRPEQTTEDAIRYVLNNPVRAGLVENPEDYPFSRSKYPLV